MCIGPGAPHLSGMGELGYRTILVVEHDDAVADALVALLVRRGFAATAVPAAHLALRLAAARSPDAWIVDEGLAGVSGAQLVSMLRASRDPTLRGAVIVGTFADAHGRAALQTAGVDRLVARPASPEDVAAAVAAALERSEAAGTPGG